ncbi:ABC transporter substrate-binding protein [Arthrobacter sp. 35W]|uniref:ABC transporter substrate-binding protein n=1 Tax=Arthrobacter sp. 35W TaxID=1132441 RepID=UPI00040FCFF8|nr:ABC transporter substrate-binding protein [Arthrobacter sp. 35W]
MGSKAGRGLVAGFGALLLVALAACTPTPTPAPTPGTSASAEPAVFSFGTGAEPAGLDPALVKDSESYRVTRQILEGLVTVDPTTGDPAPSLATSWDEEEDGLAYAFTLRDGVQFQDGTVFDAAAVCANFTRWYSLPAATRGDAASVTFKQIFGAFSGDAANSSYKSCTAVDASHVRIELGTRLTGFLQAMTQPAFAISSPAALAAGDANNLSASVAGHKVSAFGLHPVGTGPFSFGSWKDGRVTLNANPTYWGDKGQISVLNFITYDQPETRLQALKDGLIDGFDPVTPGNFDALVRNGTQILQRDPFSVVYLGINQANPLLADEKVRTALAMAIDKETLIRDFFIDGTSPTAQFIPPKLSGFNKSVTGQPFDVEKAKKALAASSYKGEPLKFYYPTNATRAYLPTPEKVYAEIARELTAVGFNIVPVPVDWADDYVGKVTSPGDHALHLMGWNGLYADPDNFVGTLFGAPNAELGLNDPQLVSKILRARSLPVGTERNEAYQSISEQIAKTVPAIPIAFPISAVALSSRVESYPVSPVLNEVFNKVKLSGH